MTEETKEQEANAVAGGQNERLVMHGLKDDEIAEVVNAITLRLHLKLPNMPQCLRELISAVTVEVLEANDLRLDA